MSTPSRRRSRGLSLVELVIATTILIGVLAMVHELVATSQRAQVYINARDRASQRGARLVADLRAAGLSSRRLFQDDAEGRSYLAAVQAPGHPILAGTRLPTVDAGGRLDRDADGVRRTGNALLLACEDRPRDVVTSGTRHRIDVVRFFVAFPTRRPGRVVEAMPDRIDLVRFTSRPFADRSSLDQVADAVEMADVVRALRAEGVDHAWLPGAAVGQAFFALQSDGTVSATPVATPVIDSLPEEPPQSMLGESRASVAPNSPALNVPAFADLDAGTPDFPGGFEVKVVGPSGGRQVLVRLVLLAGVNDGPDAASTTVRLFSVRDL